MKRIRLLPIVIVAAAGLLVLKATELVSSGSLFVTEAPKKIMTEADLPSFGRALARLRFTPPPPDPADITGAVPAKKTEQKAETPKTEPQKIAEQRPAQPLPPAQPSSSERAVLERLQERRGAIDERGKELELRENLLKAAERKVDGRIQELREIEDRLDAGTRTRKEEADKQIRTVVVMYETMKPKEAARVFDRLNLQILVPIATAMKPARMAEILAAMSPEAAEKLTVALASRSTAVSGGSGAEAANAGQPAGELPRIDQPRR
ncbi:MAG: MotE family protein [Beijerinckiaceae bacterium]